MKVETQKEIKIYYNGKEIGLKIGLLLNFAKDFYPKDRQA